VLGGNLIFERTMVFKYQKFKKLKFSRKIIIKFMKNMFDFDFDFFQNSLFLVPHKIGYFKSQN
jgi:hypothetical protein